MIQLETSELRKGGVNGIQCITCQLHREEGPPPEEMAGRIPEDKPEGLLNFVTGS